MNDEIKDAAGPMDYVEDFLFSLRSRAFQVVDVADEIVLRETALHLAERLWDDELMGRIAELERQRDGLRARLAHAVEGLRGARAYDILGDVEAER